MQKLKKILAPLLLALLAVSMTGTVFAHEDAGSEDGNHRTMDTFASDHLVIVRSSVENRTVENHFGLLVSTYRLTDRWWLTNGLVIHVAFSQETEVNEVEDEAFLYMRIAYLAITEFEDINGNGALDAGTDTIVKTIPLNTTYAPLQFNTVTSDDGKQGYEIIATTTLAGTTDGIFEVKADIFPHYAVVDGTIVPPTATKITTTITNFPFSSSNSKVALQVMAISKTVIEHETPTSEERVRVRSATANGFFSWAPTALVDGSSVDVVSSTTRLESGRWIINLAYPQVGTSNQIVHDPILGFDFGRTPILTSRLLIGAAIAAVAVFGALVYLGRRQLARVFNPKQAGPVSIPQ